MDTLVGVGAHQTVRELATKGRAAKSARYLGPHLHWDYRTSVERKLRIQAARRAWMDYKSFWYKAVDLSAKTILYRAVVFSTLVSALSAFVLTEADYRELEGFHHRNLRALLRGRASTITESGTVAKSNAEVRKMASLPSVATALRVMRLRWLQQGLRTPHHNAQLLAAWHGVFGV